MAHTIAFCFTPTLRSSFSFCRTAFIFSIATITQDLPCTQLPPPCGNFLQRLNPVYNSAFRGTRPGSSRTEPAGSTTSSETVFFREVSLCGAWPFLSGGRASFLEIRLLSLKRGIGAAAACISFLRPISSRCVVREALVQAELYSPRLLARSLLSRRYLELADHR